MVFACRSLLWRFCIFKAHQIGWNRQNQYIFTRDSIWREWLAIWCVYGGYIDRGFCNSLLSSAWPKFVTTACHACCPQFTSRSKYPVCVVVVGKEGCWYRPGAHAKGPNWIITSQLLQLSLHAALSTRIYSPTPLTQQSHDQISTHTIAFVYSYRTGLNLGYFQQFWAIFSSPRRTHLHKYPPPQHICNTYSHMCQYFHFWMYVSLKIWIIFSAN